MQNMKPLLWVRIPKIKKKANYNKITLSTIKQLSTILNEKQNHLIYPAELQLNKANTSDKETSFLDLNIKVIGW